MATSISLGKKETCPHRGHWRAELKTGKGGKRNIGIAVQGRGLKCKNIGLKKKARRKLHNRAERGKD